MIAFSWWSPQKLTNFPNLFFKTLWDSADRSSVVNLFHKAATPQLGLVGQFFYLNVSRSIKTGVRSKWIVCRSYS
jgi:hypothetical protein